MSKQLIKRAHNVIQKNGFKYLIQHTLLSKEFYLNSYYSFQDSKDNVEFFGHISNENLDRKGKDSTAYSPSRRWVVKNIINTLPITNDDAFIDIGCGKGLILSVANSFPFKKIDGIEYSPTISQVARNNCDQLHLEKTTIFCCDAGSFDKYSDYTFFYLYNPFGRDTFRKVISGIEDSLKENKRYIYIIYANPVCHDVVVSNNVVRLISISNKTVDCCNPIYIYSNNPSFASVEDDLSHDDWHIKHFNKSKESIN